MYEWEDDDGPSRSRPLVIGAIVVALAAIGWFVVRPALSDDDDQRAIRQSSSTPSTRRPRLVALRRRRPQPGPALATESTETASRTAHDEHTGDHEREHPAVDDVGHHRRRRFNRRYRPHGGSRGDDDGGINDRRPVPHDPHARVPRTGQHRCPDERTANHHHGCRVDGGGVRRHCHDRTGRHRSSNHRTAHRRAGHHRSRHYRRPGRGGCHDGVNNG